MKRIILFLALPFALKAQKFTPAEIARWQQQAAKVTVIRDNWGIPHVYGKTDADAVFGLLYAQCEDDFPRVEMNYIEKLGRSAEVKGKDEIYNDLLIRLVIDSADAVADYRNSPAWMKKLLNAFADGVNYYLYKHPQVHPALLKRFEPWHALLWTDGSIGAINTAGLTANDLKNFYAGESVAANPPRYDEEHLSGSNGFAFSPAITASHNAILYINPHVTFYFRPEVQMVSEEGLNAYGAVTWGQFFIYQGFNEHCGWMHTSSAVDIADAYAEKISSAGNGFTYEYNHQQLPVTEKKIILRYKSGKGIAADTIRSFYTKHGPVMGRRNAKWLTVKSNNRSLNGLVQCWQRTKATSFADYQKTMDLLANTSNNTVYADAEGNIAYWHGNFIPRRNPKFNWALPVDGSDTATEWKGLHTVAESIHLYNPPNGWLQNCNSTPFSVAGANSPKRGDYPVYMAPDAENFRAINAVRVLDREKQYTIDKVIAAGYDTYLSAFEKLVPALITAFDKRPVTPDSAYKNLADAIAIMKAWDLRCAENSVATTLAVEWGTKLQGTINSMPAGNETGVPDQTKKMAQFLSMVQGETLLSPFEQTLAELKEKFGDWRVQWGNINRYQRLTGDIEQHYNDDLPSIPVAFASSLWGMLPSYAARYYPGTKKRYGVTGNSFICAVEFGKRIKAKSLLAGGESGNPQSPHFKDQMQMYAKGQFKDVLFYREDVEKHAERKYHPGQ